MTTINPEYAKQSYCYLTTTGRISGEPRTIEIWFGLHDATVYMLAGGRDKANWVRNAQKEPRVTVRIKETAFKGTARLVAADGDEDALARKLLVEKYAPGYSRDLSSWGRTALPVAVDITGVEAEGASPAYRQAGPAAFDPTSPVA